MSGIGIFHTGETGPREDSIDYGRDDKNTGDGGENKGNEKDGKHLDDPDAAITDPPSEEVKNWDATQTEQGWNDRFAPPKLPSGEEAKDGDISVNTEAMRAYASNIENLIDPLKQVKEKIEAVQVAAGGFPHATDLMTQVVGAGGAGSGSVKSFTLTFIAGAIDAITKTASEVRNLAVLYEQAEDDNKVDATKVSEYISNAQSYISKITNSAGSVPGAAGVGAGAAGAGAGDPAGGVPSPAGGAGAAAT